MIIPSLTNMGASGTICQPEIAGDLARRIPQTAQPKLVDGVLPNKTCENVGGFL